MMPRGARLPFVLYFSCLGIGFIFIEITLMQRFTLALGTPIHSMTVTLATLLVAAGGGSLSLPRLRRWIGTDSRVTAVLSLFVAAYLAAAVLGGTRILNLIVHAEFPVRMAVSVLLLLPIGAVLGCYFPAGLELIGKTGPEAVAWAWGINLGFTVLGSALSIVIAQFAGFNTVLMIAAGCYILAALAYFPMRKIIGRTVPPVQ
jgi:hypothetical protein